MKPLRRIFTVLHIAILLLMSLCVLNEYVKPVFFGWLNLLSLAFPFLVVIYLIICILWLVFRQKRAIFFILAFLLFLPMARRWINFAKPAETHAELKVITFNCLNFKFGKEEITDFFEKENPDVILLQESGHEDNSLKINGMRSVHFPMATLMSKFPIVKAEKIPLEHGETGSAMYADIKIGVKIVRFVNVHLESFKLDKEMVRPARSFETNEQKADEILLRLFPTFRTHAYQIDEILTFVKNSKYPVFLCGDFNAVPNSYEYYHLGKGLEDSFAEAGNGSGTTFHDLKIPIRIDYILHSREFTAESHRTYRSKRLSDHFPVIAEFVFSKENKSSK